MAGNGAIAALVAITAPSGYVSAWAAPIIGLVAGLIVPLCIYAIDKKIDDPVGALSAHGIAGIWGTLACGLFTDPALAAYNAVGEVACSTRATSSSSACRPSASSRCSRSCSSRPTSRSPASRRSWAARCG